MPSFSKNDIGNILGKVYEEENKPAIYANVILKSVEDSSMIKGAITNEDGVFNINNVPYGEYFVSVSYIGFANYDTEKLSLKDKELNLNGIELVPANSELAQVTVTALKPILEMRADKVVFNVDGTINATGENALDLMRKSPGVVVDNNDQINLLGKSGVKVFIDGKQNYLRGDELSAFLKSLQSDQIDAIEIITNPSAKFDAEGNAGIINIRLKKDKRFGSNVFVNLGTRIGQMKSYDGSISGNYRNKFVNVFGRYGVGQYANYNNNDFLRHQYGRTYDSRNYSTYKDIENSYRFGTDFFLTEKSTIGFIIDGNISDSKNNSDGNTTIKEMNSSFIDSVLIAGNNAAGDRSNHNFNLNYKWDIGKETYLNVDLDYGKYNNSDSDSLPNSYYNNFDKGLLFSTNNYQIDTKTGIDIATAKIDYERPLFNGKVGLGSKYANVKTDNEFKYFNLIDGNSKLNENQSNNFNYTENVFAFYSNYSGAIKKLSYQAGLRLEHTKSIGELETFNEQEEPKTERAYLDFFPSVSISYPVNEKNHLQLSYTRRINRPEYQDLNPFLSQLDELTYKMGNEKLQPEYTNNIQLRHSFNNFINTTIAYSRTNNGISRIVKVTDDGRGMLLTKRNFASQDHISLNIAAPFTVNKWWSTYTSLTGFYLHNLANFEGEGTVDVKVKSWNIYSQQSFKLPGNFSFELSGWYGSPSIWEGNFKTDAMYSIDAGVKTSFLNERAKLKVSVSDLFKTMQWSGNSSFGAMEMYGNGGWDSRRVRVSLSYAFGNKNVKSRRRSTGLEDESSRIKTDNQ